MPEHNRSVDSFDEFFGAPKDDNDEKSKENDLSPSSAVAGLIKSQPVIHHRRTPSEKQSNINSKKMPLTTNLKNIPANSKRIESPPPKIYESDFDDNTSSSEKKKQNSLPPPPQSKQRTPNTPRRVSDSKLKGSYIITNRSTRRKERVLPNIRPKNRTKRLQKPLENEFEQRVLSAQNQKVHELESRLAELRRQLENERIENKTLHIIQKREEKVLQKYEDQEYDVHRVARDYTHEIAYVKEKITNEREIKMKLEKEVTDRDETLRDQTKRMKFYEKLVYEPNLDEPENLREKLKETEKNLKKYQEKIVTKEKYIQNLEKDYRQEIHQELLKQRNLKYEIENHNKKYSDLLLRFEEKSRQVGTMHIYIQRGGRRPSASSSLNHSKSRSLQSLQDTSPRFREKILEYDQRRREEEKFKPRPKLKPLPIQPPPKLERKKYIPIIPPKTKIIKPVHQEKLPIIENEHLPPKDKSPVRRLSTPKSIDEDENETIIKPIRQRTPSPPSPPPSLPPPKPIQRNEEYISQAPIHKRPLTPLSPPVEPKIDTNKNTTTTNLFKQTELSPSPSPPPAKIQATRELDDKWTDLFEINKKEESTKDDLLAKLISDEQQERKSVTTTKPSSPSSQRPSMIMFEPSSILTNGNQKKSSTRITTTNVYDFDQAVINLHEGKPVTTPPTIIPTKTTVDPFETLFDNNTTKSINRMNNRDVTFTTTQEKSDHFDSLFTHSTNAVDTSTIIKPNIRQIPSQNDKLQRPKVVTNVPRPVPNRTVAEELEEFVL